MSTSLLTTRRFAPLFWTQFFAAFSDNFLKQALIFLILFKIAGAIAAQSGGAPAAFGFLMLIFSLACWGASLFIPPTGQGAPDLVIRRNVVASTASLLNHLRDDKRIWWGAFVTSWFWLAGAVIATVMQPLVKDVLGGTEQVIITCNAIF